MNTKSAILKVFQETYPSDLSIKEVARKAGITRETASKYIAVLEAESKIKAARKVRNTKFFRFVPDAATLVKDIGERLETFLEEGFVLEVLDEDEIKALRKARKILGRKLRE